MVLKYIKRALTIAGSIVALIVVIFFTGVLWPADWVSPVTTDTPLLITNVSVVDIDKGVLHPRQDVLIDNGRIAALGPEGEVSRPASAQKIDGENRFLMPALWDMHAHVYKISPLLDMPLYIRYGVTNVRDMMSCPLEGDPFVACPGDHDRWTHEAVTGTRVGPRIVGTASFMANGPAIVDRLKGVPEYFGTATPEQARAFVKHFAGRVDAIKVYNDIPREAYFALVEEARRQDMDVVGHRPRAVSAMDAARHQKSIEHARFILHESFSGSEALRASAGTAQWHEDRRRMLDEHDPARAQAILDEMRRAGTWYVPTHLTRWADAYADDPRVREDLLLRYLHPLMKWQWLEDVNKTVDADPSPEARATYREFYEKGLELTAAAHRAGVKVLVGTDYIVAGATVHDELEQLVHAGLKPADALRAATLSPAEYFGLQEQFGRVAEGMVADLILLTGNPLQDIQNTRRIESVVFNGNLYDNSVLDTISDHVEDRAASWTVACKILWRFIRNPVAY